MLERECCWPRHRGWIRLTFFSPLSFLLDWLRFPFSSCCRRVRSAWRAGARRLCACRYHCRRCPCSSRSFLGRHEQLRRTFSTTEKSFLVLQRERSFPLKSIGQARATRKMLDQLKKSSSPEQRLFVGPLDLRRTNYNDTFIYHLMLQLRPATYFSQSHQTKWCDLDLRFAAR